MCSCELMELKTTEHEFHYVIKCKCLVLSAAAFPAIYNYKLLLQIRHTVQFIMYIDRTHSYQFHYVH